MHISNAVIDPGVAAATGLIGAVGLGYGLRTLEARHGERTTVLMGVTAAFVFAAQMVNFPVGPGVSGHLLGGVLASVLLGPWAGAVVIAAVLIVQCLLFGDGGLMALGANFLNMGLIGSVVGYAVYAPIRRAVGGRAGVVFGAMAAAWLSVVLAAGAFSVELAASGRPGGFLRVLSWMALVHAVIGVGEAVITGLVLRFILQTRPDLIDDPDAGEPGAGGPSRVKGWLQVAVAGLAVALGVGIFLAPFASESDDGLEFVGKKLGFVAEAEPAPALPMPPPMPDYKFPGVGSLRAATAAAGAAGTLVVFAVGVSLAAVVDRAGRVARGVSARPDGPDGVTPDAA